jgi:FtsP/CotA-like multicopper oxidase with cupredoxin domain
MRARRSNGMRWGIARNLGLALLSATLLVDAHPAVAQLLPGGIACTVDPGGGKFPTFNLTTGVGYVNVSDGNTVFMWGFSESGKPFQYPGPILCVNEGDTVTIRLQNTLPDDDVSIIFPGHEAVLADGAPAQPQFIGANLVSLTNMAARGGGSVTYSFVASKPGTYVYESGTEPQKQVRMGLFGALVVRPALGATYAYNRADAQYTPAEEFMVLLSEADPYQNQAVENGQTFNLNNYHPRYWFVNGRTFPDTIAPNGASWLPSQPYGALATIHPYDPGSHPHPGLIRYLSFGSENFPFHPHGNNGLVVGRDGNPLEGPAGQDLSFEKFAINIGPGQTWDVLFKWHDAEGYDSITNPIPVVIPPPTILEPGVFYSGSPYLGEKGPMPPGFTSQNACGEYYIITHNHALYQITCWGTNMCGAITYLRIDPPLPNPYCR